MSEADEEMTKLLKLYAYMKQEYASILKFFSEDQATTRIDDFFGTFAGFISDFKVRSGRKSMASSSVRWIYIMRRAFIILFQKEVQKNCLFCLAESSEGESPGKGEKRTPRNKEEGAGQQEERRLQALLQIKQEHRRRDEEGARSQSPSRQED